MTTLQAVSKERLLLWFFRDLSDDQRLKLLRFCFYPDTEFSTHTSQRIAFHRILEALSSIEPAEQEPVAWFTTDIRGRIAEKTDFPSVADAWRDQGYTVRPLYASPASPEAEKVRATDEMVLVPRKPTQAMIDAGLTVQRSANAHQRRAIWAAMIEAAPHLGAEQWVR